MDFLAELKDATTTFQNEMYLTFEVGNREKVEELKKEFDKENKLYSVTIRDIDSNRTRKQNSLLWRLIGAINFKSNGSRKAEDDESIYIQALIDSGACVERFEGTPIDLMNETNKRTIRHAVLVDEYDDHQYVWTIYPGSSNFNKKQMGTLIDHVLDIAAMLQIDVFYWEKQFYG